MARFFRSDEATYESVRLSLDAAWGHIAPTTCIEPAATAPRDSVGRLLVGVQDEFCAYAAVAAVLPGLLESGAVEEISEAEYWASAPGPIDGP